MKKFLYATALLAASTSIAHGIVIRDDRPDERYVALGQGHDEVVDLNGATGTLIDKRWVLTAAHEGMTLSPYSSWAKIKGRVYKADRVIIQPAFLKNGIRGRDLCLMHLTEDVVGVEPAGLYEWKDEVNQTVLFVGGGDTGNGLTGPTGNDGKRRGANNVLTGADENHVSFIFDAPGKALDLEGISGPGDSGGPALLQKNGKWYVAGVSSFNRGEKACTYGSTEVYARVSTAIDWIKTTMREVPASTLEWTLHAPFSGWSSDRNSEITGALVNAYLSGSVEQYEAFNQKYRTPSILKDKTPEQRAKAYKAYREHFGDLEVAEYATFGNKSVAVLLRSKTGQEVVINVFIGGDGPTATFDGWNMGSSG